MDQCLWRREKVRSIQWISACGGGRKLGLYSGSVPVEEGES